jgi:pyrroline-5-carboxylate reductase
LLCSNRYSHTRYQSIECKNIKVIGVKVLNQDDRFLQLWYYLQNTIERKSYNFMSIKKIAVIGGGNLGSAIARGILFTKAIEPCRLHVTRRRSELISYLAESGVKIGSDNQAAVKHADIIFLAVKPYQIADVIAEIKESFKKDCIIISLAAGVEIAELKRMTGEEKSVFRAMPNTAIAIGQSMTCVSTNETSKKQQQIVKELFEKLGALEFIPEELMAGATVLAACGIAFALRFIRAATQGGVEIGFGSDLALKITSQTVKGAAELLIEGRVHPEAEIDKVTTPRGITISGLNEMEYRGFSSSLIKGLLTSFEKINKAGKKK